LGKAISLCSKDTSVQHGKYLQNVADDKWFEAKAPKTSIAQMCDSSKYESPPVRDGSSRHVNWRKKNVPIKQIGMMGNRHHKE
jgi:hypothetical protein